MITTVTASLLVFTLVFQMFSLLTIESMGNRKGPTVLQQIRFVCSSWPGGSTAYLSCSLAYIFNFGQVRFHSNPNEVTMALPSDAVRGTQLFADTLWLRLTCLNSFLCQDTLRQLDDDTNTPAYCLFYTTWLLVVFCMCCALSEFVCKRNRNVINLFSGILLMIAGNNSVC